MRPLLLFKNKSFDGLENFNKPKRTVFLKCLVLVQQAEISKAWFYGTDWSVFEY